MRRIGFIVLMLFALVAGVAHPQAQEKVWRLGMLAVLEDPLVPSIVLSELKRRGFVEGRNLVVDVHIGTADQMPQLVRELLAAKPDVIVAISDWAVHPAKRATNVVPIVASPLGVDPVAAGLAASWGTTRWQRHRRYVDRSGARDQASRSTTPSCSKSASHRHASDSSRDYRARIGADARGCCESRYPASGILC